VYEDIVKKNMENGKKKEVYFEKIKLDRKVMMEEIVDEKGKRELIGKVNMK
jgi:hypothetical protein